MGWSYHEAMVTQHYELVEILSDCQRLIVAAVLMVHASDEQARFAARQRARGYVRSIHHALGGDDPE